MINSSYANRLVEMLPEDIRLVQQAKSGDTNAFIKLYDAFVEPVFRYVYFQVADDHIAEGITFQVFINAWKQLGNHRLFGLNFIAWLYTIARDQIQTYYRTHKKAVVSDQDFLITKARNLGAEEVEGVYNPQILRNALQSLPKDEQQVLVLKFVFDMPNKSIIRLMNKYDVDIHILQFRALQSLAGGLENKEMAISTNKIRRIVEDCQGKIFNGTSTVEECLARFPEFAAELDPLLRTIFSLHRARALRPLSTFTAYSRATLLHYVLSHPRLSQNTVAATWRFSYASMAVLIMTLIFTGTVFAQSALPGETLYPWKRTSEQLWRVISPDQVAIDIALANRRLSEWIAVSRDPLLSVNAMKGYLEALSKLETHDAETVAAIVPALQVQQQTLGDAGLSSPELNDYLSVAVLIVPVSTQIPPSPTATTTASLVPTTTNTSTDLPTTTNTPTDIPTVTTTPTKFPTETATDIPTDIPTATNTATDVPTETPTDISTPTDIPTDVPTDAPTETPTLEPTLTP